MDVTVSMTKEEFLEFVQWESEKNRYEAKVRQIRDSLNYMANKVEMAIDEDQKRPGKVKIIDQDHAAELLELANDQLS